MMKSIDWLINSNEAQDQSALKSQKDTVDKLTPIVSGFVLLQEAL